MSKSKLIGFKGKRGFWRAMEASRRATPNPRAHELPDESWVGVGDVILRGERQDQMLYGARGSACWASETH